MTHNITVAAGDAIDINANGVTLDLNGFTISSTENPATTGDGISVGKDLKNITIANGFIQGGVTNNGSGIYGGSGFGYGIFFSLDSTVAPANVLVSGVSVSGCLGAGIFLNGDSQVVESCTVRTIGGYGICASVVKGCSAIDCGNHAISGYQISDCRGQCSGNGAGINSFGTVQNCYGVSGTYFGVYALNAQNCYGVSSNGNYTGLSATTALNCYGLHGLTATIAQNCYGYSANNASGLSATTAQNCYGYSGGNGIGLSAVTATGCYGSSSSGTGLSALIATGCHGVSTTGFALDVTHNLNSY